MSNSMRVAIIGSGLVGRILAITLLESFADIRIDLYDKSTDFSGKSSCGYAAAGMVAPVFFVLSESLIALDQPLRLQHIHCNNRDDDSVGIDC